MSEASDFPVVSAVITTFNRGETVAEAIDSALCQGIPSMEILVVDDASTDGTANAIERRYSNDKAVRVIQRKTNGGPPAARNTGLREARGEFVALLDSDDLWLPGYISSQLEVLRSTGADLVLGNARTQGQDGSWQLLFDRPDWQLPDSPAAMCDSGFAIPTSTVIRAKVARELGFDERFHRCDDLDFMFRFNDLGYRCVGNPEALAEYRAQPGQLTADRDTLMLDVYKVRMHHSKAHPELLRPGLIYDRQFGPILMRAGRPAEAYPHLRRAWMARPFDLAVLSLLVRACFARLR